MRVDLITLGRTSMDLFSLDIGAPFEAIESFETGVGGSPTNIAIGSSRLGLQVTALTAVGEDRVGDFVVRYLANESIDTQFIPRKPGTRTGLAVLGIEPPDRFPLVFYRDNVADIQLSIDDITDAPWHECRAILLSGTALSRGPCRDATLFAAEIGDGSSATVYVDLDLRPDQWHSPRAYGLNVRTITPHADVLIGTEEEFYAAFTENPEPIMAGADLGAAQQAELESTLAHVQTMHPNVVLVVKRGASGVTLMSADSAQHVDGYSVEILNTVGAGDAFASGLIFARLRGDDWRNAAQFANACGAIVVTRHGCAKAMPRLDEVEAFLATRSNNL